MVDSPPNQIIYNQFSARDWGWGPGFARRGHWAASRVIFGYHDWEGAPGTSWGEAREDPTIHRTAPSPPKNDLAQDIHGGETEKL